MTYLSGPAVKTLLLRTVVPSVSSAEVPVTVILPKALSMTLVTRTCNKMHGQFTHHQHWQLALGTLIKCTYKIFNFFPRNLQAKSKGSDKSLIIAPQQHTLYMLTNECIFFTNYFSCQIHFPGIVLGNKNVSHEIHMQQSASQGFVNTQASKVNSSLNLQFTMPYKQLSCSILIVF